MQQLMKQAQKMQQQLAAAQAELAETEVSGSAAGGLVTATVTGSGELLSIRMMWRRCRISSLPRSGTLPTARVRSRPKSSDH